MRLEDAGNFTFPGFSGFVSGWSGGSQAGLGGGDSAQRPLFLVGHLGEHVVHDRAVFGLRAEQDHLGGLNHGARRWYQTV